MCVYLRERKAQCEEAIQRDETDEEGGDLRAEEREKARQLTSTALFPPVRVP
jgi:hypothetical protein